MTTVEADNQWNLDKSMAFYKDRFADASDFTFVSSHVEFVVCVENFLYLQADWSIEDREIAQSPHPPCAVSPNGQSQWPQSAHR